MRTIRIRLCKLVAVLMFCSVAGTAHATVLKVGVYQNFPLTHVDENGRAKGFFIDILEYTARENDWTIEYVPAPWSVCLENLKKGRIDLLGVIAYSEERAAHIDFSYESLLTEWGQIYTQPGAKVDTILDLHEKKVAVLQEDMHFHNLKARLDQFGLKSRFVEAFEYKDVLRLVESGRCAAGLVSQFYGIQHDRKFDVVKTTIVLSPQKLYWAVPKGRNRYVLDHLDSVLRKIKAQDGSIYQQSLDKWFGIPTQTAYSPWMAGALVGISVLLLLFTAIAILFRHQLNLKTRALVTKTESLAREIDSRKEVEFNLRRSEEKFFNLFNTSPIWMMVATVKEGRILEANRAFSRITGYEASDVIGRTAVEIGLWPDPSQRHAVVDIIRKQGGLNAYPIQFKMRNGDLRHFLWSCIILELEHENCFLSTLLDVTGHKKAEREIKAYRDQLDALLRAIPNPLYAKDRQGRYIFFNQAFLDFFDTSREKLLGKTVHEVWDSENARRYHEEDMTAMVKDTLQIYQRKVADGQGHRQDVVYTQACFHGTDGSVQGLVGTLTDISETKQAEEALRQSEARFRAVLEANPDPVVLYDMQGRVLFFNPAFTKVFGWTLEERKGKTMDVFVPDANWSETEAMISKILAGESLSGDETTRYTKDGRLIPVSISAGLFYDHDGNQAGSVITLRDISEQKHLQEQLQQSQRLEAIGTLAGGIAHDFNNILSAIIGYTDLSLMTLPKDTPLKDNLNKILESGNRARDLIRQILAFSRQNAPQKQTADIKPLIKEVLKLLRASLPSNIEIKQNLKGFSTIMCDPTQIHQVVMNLCTNAGQSLMETGGRLTVTMRDVSAKEDPGVSKAGLSDGPYLKLQVSDTGKGIPPEVMDRIFDPFFTTKGRGSGSGMGLAVAHGIIENHGGAITAEAGPERGTVFTVYLPLVKSKKITQSQIESPLPMGNERILFVDDEMHIADLGRQMLQRLGYTVIAETSSVNALALFEKDPHQFDLVITDLTMPKITGDILARRLLRLTPDLPVIMCTGYSERFSKEETTHLGIKGFLMKPMTLRDLAQMVRSVLDARIRPQSP
jgi:PAS domain S-box-containing protein